MDIEYLKANPANELEELLAFDRRIFRSFPDDLFEPEDWNDVDSYWMITQGAKVGCCAFEENCDYDETPRSGCLYIASTGILPEFQGKGLGRIQKEWQIDFARKHGFSSIVTDMRTSNVRMRKLNESLGFTLRCVHEDYYTAPNEAAVVMELSLPPHNK